MERQDVVEGLCAACRARGSKQKSSEGLFEQPVRRAHTHTHTRACAQNPQTAYWLWFPSVKSGIRNNLVWGGQSLWTHGFQGLLSIYNHPPDRKKHHIYSDKATRAPGLCP